MRVARSWTLLASLMIGITVFGTVTCILRVPLDEISHALGNPQFLSRALRAFVLVDNFVPFVC